MILSTGGGCLFPGGLVPGGCWSGGVPGSRGVPGPGAACWRSPRTATAAGSTHPTAMHSFSPCFSSSIFLLAQE